MKCRCVDVKSSLSLLCRSLTYDSPIICIQDHDKKLKTIVNHCEASLNQLRSQVGQTQDRLIKLNAELQTERNRRKELERELESIRLQGRSMNNAKPYAI